MAVKCKNGHWYDPNMYRSCPHCKRAGEQLRLTLDNVEEDDHTVSIADVDVSLGEQLGEIVSAREESQDNIFQDSSREQEEDDHTISFGFFGWKKEKPVTGWLVCVSGEEKGQDYRLHSGKNFIGRSPSMDIVLVEDKMVARQKHSSITYDPRGNHFYLTPEGGNIVYCNEEMIEKEKQLQQGDRIQMGNTVLVFIPFCQEGIIWEEE